MQLGWSVLQMLDRPAPHALHSCHLLEGIKLRIECEVMSLGFASHERKKPGCAFASTGFLMVGMR
jgi:hypothetical protein